MLTTFLKIADDIYIYMTKLLKTYFYGGSAVFTRFFLSLVSGKPIESVFVGYHIIQSVRDYAQNYGSAHRRFCIVDDNWKLNDVICGLNILSVDS